MYIESITCDGYGGFHLPGMLWLPEGSEANSAAHPKVILQITHGMTEHIGRYADFARVLTEAGIAAAGFDLRGHGRNPGSPDCASFGEDGWEATLEDMHLFHQYLTARFPDVPCVMLGFSLGSFLLREYLNRYPDPLAGAIIMGTGQQPGAVLSIIMAIVKTQIKKAGFDNTTPLVKKLSFETYNQKFKPNRTASDWLCADEEQLDTYCADPLCRRDISSGLFWQLLGSMKRTAGSRAYQNWNPKMPVLLLSGQDDPVGDAGAGVLRMKADMEKAGLKNVSLQLAAGARHDLLHECKSGAAKQAQEIVLEWMRDNARTKLGV